MLLSRLSISARFLLVLAVGLVFQAGLSAVSLVNLRQSMVADRVTEVRHLVDVACSIVAFYHDEAARGAMTDQAARKAAAEAARAPAMTEQLAALDHGGRRLWNGRTPPRLRPATAAEAATWREAFAEAVADGDA
jgi:hypothetical protein